MHLFSNMLHLLADLCSTSSISSFCHRMTVSLCFFGRGFFACEMALNVCPLDYLISRAGYLILFLLLHNAQIERERGSALLGAGKADTRQNPRLHRKPHLWQFLDCSHVRGRRWCSVFRFVCMQFRKVLCVHSGYSASSGVWHEKCILLGLFL